MQHLQQIVSLAERHGRTAIVHGHSVAIFTAMRRDLDRGFRHVNFHVDHASSLEQAQAILDGSRLWRRSKTAAAARRA